jgi:hypothetical protein
MSNELTDWGSADVKQALADFEVAAGPAPIPELLFSRPQPRVPTAPARPQMRRRIGDGPGGMGSNGQNASGVDWGGIASAIAEFGTGAMQAGFAYDLQRRELENAARSGNTEAAGLLAALQDMQSSLTPDSGAAGMSTGVLVVGGLLVLALGGGLIWALSKKK